MAYKKFVKKVAKKVGRAVKRRYFKGKGYSKPNLGTMFSDIAVLKKMVNAEKKRLVTSSQGQTCAQVSVNTSGHFIVDVTPNPTQGNGYNQKSGSSIKWNSSHYDFQITGQGSCLSGITLKMQWVKVVGLPYATLADIFGKFISPNPFITGGTIYDINSNRDPDYFKNFVVIKTQYVTLRPDSVTGDIPVKQISTGLKLKNHHVRNNDNDPTLSMGQIFLLITANTGNSGATNSTCVGMANNTALSGIGFQYIRTDYFYDN